MRWQGIGLRKSEEATIPPLLNCLVIKGMGWQWVGGGLGWHRWGWQGVGVAGGGGGKGQE